MKLIISHFHNEEYLLPFWLKHHIELFDHGILIDYHSTDASREICRELAPQWQTISSEYSEYSDIMCDFEVMKHEEKYTNAWKLALHPSEFLVGSGFSEVLHHLDVYSLMAARIPGAIMVDRNRPTALGSDRPLVNQADYGFFPEELPLSHLDYSNFEWSWILNANRSRVLHRHTIGAYFAGRSSAALTRQIDLRESRLHIWWYGFSPWTPEFIYRKLQTNAKMDRMTRPNVAGFTPEEDYYSLSNTRDALLAYSHKLIN